MVMATLVAPATTRVPLLGTYHLYLLPGHFFLQTMLLISSSNRSQVTFTNLLCQCYSESPYSVKCCLHDGKFQLQFPFVYSHCGRFASDFRWLQCFRMHRSSLVGDFSTQSSKLLGIGYLVFCVKCGDLRKVMTINAI